MVTATWQRDEQRNYQRTLAPAYIFAPELYDILKRLPSYGALEETAKSSSTVGPLLGKLQYVPYKVWTLRKLG